MENELLNSSFSAVSRETKQVEHTYTEIMEAHCPLYLDAGMSYSDYWDGETEMVIPYRRLLERKREWQNQMLWLQGRYIYDALTAVMPALSIKSKSTKIEPYIEEPYPITRKMEKEREEEKQRKQFEKGIAYMKSFTEVFNKRFKAKES